MGCQCHSSRHLCNHSRATANETANTKEAKYKAMAINSIVSQRSGGHDLRFEKGAVICKY